MERYGLILLATLGPYAVQVALFFVAFRIRSIAVTFKHCMVIAAVPQILLFVVRIPLPAIVTILIVLAATIWLITRYSEAELFPDAALIAVAVLLLSSLTIHYGIEPLLPENSWLRGMLP